jgi:MFS family permease
MTAHIPRMIARQPLPGTAIMPGRANMHPISNPFARWPSFAALLAARALSLVGDGIGALALIVYVERTSGTGKSVGLLLLMVSLPSVLSPLTGVVADRFDRRRVIAGCEVVQGLVTAVIVVWLPGLAALLLLVLVKSSAATIADPATRSAVPALVADDQLERANALLGGLREGALVLGPLLGGVLVAVWNVRGALIADTATFFVGVPLLLRLPQLRPEPAAGMRGATAAPERFFTQARAGLRYAMDHRLVRAVVVGFFLLGFTGADDVALPFLARHLHAGAEGLGVLYAATAAGLLVGFAWLLRFPPRHALAAGFVGGCVVAGLANAATGIAPAIAIAVAFQVVRGIATAAIDTNLQTMLQRSVEPAMLGRVFANVYGAVGVASAVSVLLGGVLLDATSARFVLVTVGAIGVVAGLTSALLLRPEPAGL